MSLLRARMKLNDGARRLNVDLTVGEGITALFGPSGAGKTTLLHCLAGLLRPEEGEITLHGRRLFDSARGVSLPPEHRRVGCVFQDARLFPHLSVRRNLEYGYVAGGAGATPAEIHELLELGPFLDRRPDAVSGGEARRVAIGRALLASPELLLLDEPLSGLDDGRKQTVLSLLDRVRSELRVPMLFVSHSLGEILQLTTEVAVLEHGDLLGQGALHDVLGGDQVYRLANRLGLESLLPIEIVGTSREDGLTHGRLGEQDVYLPPVDRAPGTRGLAAVRPEDVILARAPVEGTSAQNALLGTVTRVSPLTDRLLVTVDVGAALRTEISARSARRLGVEVGQPVYCLIKAFSFRWRRFES